MCAVLDEVGCSLFMMVMLFDLRWARMYRTSAYTRACLFAGYATCHPRCSAVLDDVRL